MSDHNDCRLCGYPHNDEPGQLCNQCETDKRRGYAVSMLVGRCRTGEEQGGTLRHAIPLPFSTFGAAICGAKPGLRSNGWSDFGRGGIVTCLRCLKKIGDSI